MGLLCSALKNSISIAPTGEIRPCYLHDFNHDYNVDKISIQDYREKVALPMYKEMKKTGKLPKGCWKCKSIKHYEIFNKYLKWYEANESEELLMLDISLSNLCNNGCIMCNKKNSSYYKKIEKNMFVFPIQTGAQELKINHSKKVFEDLCSNVKSLKELYIKGGEPTLDTKVQDILDYLISIDKTDTVIKLNTNLTNTNKRFMDSISKFPYKNVSFSIDAKGELNNVLRHPSKFNSVIKNLQRWTEIKTEQDRYNISSVISIYNLFKYPELKKYLKQNFNEYIHFYHINILQTPEYMDISHVNKKIFNQALLLYDVSDRKTLIDYYNNKKTKNNINDYEVFTKRSIQWFNSRGYDLSITGNPFFEGI
jgi:radical SAM protein with 4Fe4S-binding SPASM domain